MGSSEEMIFQMVHDYIEMSSTLSPSLVTSSISLQVSPLFHQNSSFITLKETLGSIKDVESVILEKVLKYMINMKKFDYNSTLKKSLVMNLKKEGYDASLCKTSWVTSFKCQGDNYEFIDVMVEDDNDSKMGRLIIDIDFKSQFELARPTTTYTELLNILPSIYIGNEEKLGKIISILCSAAKRSLKENGLHIPPWRSINYMKSKWLSCHYQKIPMETNCDHEKSEWIPLVEKSEWVPPVVKQRGKGLVGVRSGLSSQFSEMRINCC